MAYNAFTREELKRRFKLSVHENRELDGAVKPIAISALLRQSLDEGAPLALAMSTDKARSELIIAPILMEVRRQLGGRFSLFSGIEFAVDAERGLTGFCDFLMSASTSQMEIEAPVLAIVEAKNENIRMGIPQCIAEMFAATLFNEQREQAKRTVYGAVTTGSDWRFLRMHGLDVEIDREEFYLREVERVVGVLVSMLAQSAPEPS
jgi:hypothetical protein